MSVNLGRYEFAGPFSTLEELEDKPGLYAILCMSGEDFRMLEIQGAALVQTEIAKAFAANSWADACTGKIRVAVYYNSDQHHLEVVREDILELTCDIT